MPSGWTLPGAKPYYNLGQAYLLKLRMKEAEEEFQRAKSLQPQLISYHTSISSRNPNRLVIDRTIDPSRIWGRILAPTPERDQVAQGLWGVLWGGVPLEYGEIGGGFPIWSSGSGPSHFPAVVADPEL